MANNLEPVVQSSGEETNSSSSDEQVSTNAEPTITTNVGTKNPVPESSESGEESSESEQEEEAQSKNAEPTNVVGAKKPLSESAEESSESEEDESEVAKPQTQQQLTPPKKPVLESSQSEEEKEETSVVKPKLTPAKRSLHVPDGKENEILKTPVAKKGKKGKKTETTEKVKNSLASVLFKRFWTDEDVIVILNALFEYAEEVNAANCDAFLDKIKKDLHSLEVTKGQLMDKIRKLKKKFENNRRKKVRKFANSLEKDAYDLSLKIWGNSESGAIVVAAANGNTVKGKGKTVEANDRAGNEAEAVEGGNVKVAAANGFGFFGDNVEKVLSIGVDMFEGAKEVKGAKEWRKLQREDMELAYKHVNIVQAQMKLVLDNME